MARKIKLPPTHRNELAEKTNGIGLGAQKSIHKAFIPLLHVPLNWDFTGYSVRSASAVSEP